MMFRPDVGIADLRGNVPTRVEKLRAADYDAILLAKAGIDRLELDLSEFQVRVLDPRWFVPAPAQGALAPPADRRNPAPDTRPPPPAPPPADAPGSWPRAFET